MMNKEYLNVAVADPREEVHVLFKNAFQEMKMEIRVHSFHSGNDLSDHMENKLGTVPDVLFLRYDFPDDDAMECLQRMKADPEFDPVITVMYASAIPPEEEEYIFVCGAHVVMQQPDTGTDLKKVLTEFMIICWQFHTSGLSRNNFIMKV
ncbi:response regulator [Chryseobacterium hagamense]|uniref:Response regulatory domain-containing protein n=1 Tax=Chryseobacterium hagamense TaxID=395935 RepID=A0A511YPB5_9FLAO|nr:response regulator [Chryseobacterium hagamense]GEN77041.1 hypothetical protein CHA01nite_27810 [Chryseobacterium hagamense]